MSKKLVVRNCTLIHTHYLLYFLPNSDFSPMIITENKRCGLIKKGGFETLWGDNLNVFKWICTLTGVWILIQLEKFQKLLMLLFSQQTSEFLKADQVILMCRHICELLLWAHDRNQPFIIAKSI